MPKLKIILQFNIFWLILGLILTIYVYFFTQIIKYDSVYDLNVSNIEGQITNFSINGDKLALDIKAQENIKATYYFSSEDEKNNYLDTLCLGCTVRLQGEFSVPLNNTIPNTFNYRKFLYNKKIYRIFKIADIKSIKQSANLFWQIKNYFYKRIERQENKDYLKIFILGDKSLISSEEYNNFQANGVAHLLAISGMHIGIFLKILDRLLKKVKLKQKFIIMASVLLFYAFLTNFAASIMRAVIFYLFLNLKKIFNLKISNFKVLILTASFLLIINPFFIYDVGFLYSFVITGALIFNSKLIKGNYFKQLLIISIISFLFSLPITINLNYEVNLMSILANLIFVPYISLIVYPLSLLTFLMPFFSSIFNILIMILKDLNIYTEKLAFFLNFPKMNCWAIFLYYLFLIISRYNFKWFLGLLILLLIVKIIPYSDSNYYIGYLDVGQGDCAIIISPFKQQVILIDTGGKITYEKEAWAKSSKEYHLSDNVIKFLKSKGITKVDYLILSHGDNDHMGESLNLVNNLKIAKVIFNRGDFNELEQNLIKELETKKIAYYQNVAQLNIGNNILSFLNTGLYADENDNSLVLYTKINNYRFLFMGDAGIEVENNLINKYLINNITVLKVGHHGSKTSTSLSFVEAIKPYCAIISVGKNNIYGHPNAEVLENLKTSKIYRTDNDGSIIFTINKNLKVTTFSP